ncbi:MAG TPA: alcohol dehydrogenase catalytic domain-containing protein, partial [Ardenticatenaceae bacterium]|nr:alcohol dehydrogenase catalytic domain-containing protein [Ardenticatenaceae bacterium]
GRIEFVEKPMPEPGPGQLLVQVKANALCGSERGQFLNGSDVTPGHEAAGVVVAAGPATQTQPGTPGVIYLMDFCGACRSCRLGFTNQCLDKRADMGFNRDGGYGLFELVHETIFFPVDPDLPLAEATLLLDIMGTGGHAIERARLVHPDVHSILIAGAGPVGLGVLAMARIILGDAIPILISDVVPYRLALAERLGGTPIALTTGTLEAGARAVGLDSMDLAIDTSGKASARQASLRLLGKRGVLVCVGHGEELVVDVSRDLIAPERAVLGSEYFRFGELPINLERLRVHRSYLRQIITHRFPLADIRQAFELFFAGQAGKVVVEK